MAIEILLDVILVSHILIAYSWTGGLRWSLQPAEYGVEKETIFFSP
jgi:hypothetical protein